MKKFKINDLLKQIIIVNSYIEPKDKDKLIKEINLSEVTSLEADKIIAGVLNYGVLLSKEELKKIPIVDCKKLNTSLYLLLKYYELMDIESLNEALDSMITINIDETTGGFYEKDTMVPLSAVNDIIDGYVLASKPLEDEEYIVGTNEISIDDVKVNYGKENMIREFDKELFS